MLLNRLLPGVPALAASRSSKESPEKEGVRLGVGVSHGRGGGLCICVWGRFRLGLWLRLGGGLWFGLWGRLGLGLGGRLRLGLRLGLGFGLGMDRGQCQGRDQEELKVRCEYLGMMVQD